jgi:outer membrane lipoprotein carrier protein
MKRERVFMKSLFRRILPILALAVQTLLFTPDAPGADPARQGAPAGSGSTGAPRPAQEAAFARDPELDGILERMETVYHGIRTFQARFDQETETKSLRRTRRSSGWIYVEKPDKIRWSYEAPEPQEVYVLGDRVFLWIPARNQVLKSSEADMPGMAQIRVLLAQGRLSESFTITLLPPPADSEGFHCLRLVPTETAKLSLEEMILFVRKEDSLLERTESRDLVGNVTRIRFHDWRVNGDLSPDLFRFEIPQGAEVLEGAF